MGYAVVEPLYTSFNLKYLEALSFFSDIFCMERRISQRLQYPIYWCDSGELCPTMRFAMQVPQGTSWAVTKEVTTKHETGRYALNSARKRPPISLEETIHS